jgi:hypothetical protein
MPPHPDLVIVRIADEGARVMPADQTPPVSIELHGPVPDVVSERARERVTALLRIAHGDVSPVHIVLTKTTDPEVDKPATARVTLAVDGHMVLVQTADMTTWAALEHMAARLGTRLEQLARYRARDHDADVVGHRGNSTLAHYPGGYAACAWGGPWLR